MDSDDDSTLGDVLEVRADMDSRHVYLFGAVDDEAAFRTVATLMTMDSESHEPITLLLLTAGGGIEAGYAIYDAIKMITSPVTAIVLGGAMSMGAIILQAADQRLMTPHARMMIHTGSVTISGEIDSDKMISLGRELSETREAFIGVLGERADISATKIRKLLLKESYFSAHQALANGFIDGVVDLFPKGSPMRPKKARATQ